MHPSDALGGVALLSPLAREAAHLSDPELDLVLRLDVLPLQNQPGAAGSVDPALGKRLDALYGDNSVKLSVDPSYNRGTIRGPDIAALRRICFKTPRPQTCRLAFLNPPSMPTCSRKCDVVRYLGSRILYRSATPPPPSPPPPPPRSAAPMSNRLGSARL